MAMEKKMSAPLSINAFTESSDARSRIKFKMPASLPQRPASKRPAESPRVSKNRLIDYGFFGDVAAVGEVVVAAAGLVAGFSVVVVGLLALFRVVMTSPVKSTLSLE